MHYIFYMKNIVIALSILFIVLAQQEDRPDPSQQAIPKSQLTHLINPQTEQAKKKSFENPHNNQPSTPKNPFDHGQIDPNSKSKYKGENPFQFTDPSLGNQGRPSRKSRRDWMNQHRKRHEGATVTETKIENDHWFSMDSAITRIVIAVLSLFVLLSICIRRIRNIKRSNGCCNHCQQTTTNKASNSCFQEHTTVTDSIQPGQTQASNSKNDLSDEAIEIPIEEED